VSDPSEHWAPDLVDREFTVRRPNRLWVADLTYVATWAGFLYVAVVIDAFSRRVIGWPMEPHLRTELVLAALEMAYSQRAPCPKVNFRICASKPSSSSRSSACSRSAKKSKL
jgi:putative transposase